MKMTMPTGAEKNLQRAARAYRLALSTKEDAARIAQEFPAASKKLDEVARLLISEGKKCEAAETPVIKHDKT
jgi:hypothetical protein